MPRPPRAVRISVLLLAASCLGLTMCHHVERNAASREEAARSVKSEGELAPAPDVAPSPAAPVAAPVAAPAPNLDSTAGVANPDAPPSTAAASAPTSAPVASPRPRKRRPAANAAPQQAAPPPREIPFAATKAPSGLY